MSASTSLSSLEQLEGLLKWWMQSLQQMGSHLGSASSGYDTEQSVATLLKEKEGGLSTDYVG